MTHARYLAELVAKYIAALGDARITRTQTRVLATDLSLYLRRLSLWFDLSMVCWANYVSRLIRDGRLDPADQRSVIRYVPLRESRFTTISEAKKYWLQIKSGMHWLLCPGPYNLVTFGDLAPSLARKLNYCVVPKVLVVESPGIFLGDFDTVVYRNARCRAEERADLILHLSSRRLTWDLDPAQQHVFPLFYRRDTFAARRQNRAYFRDVLGKFLWKLQAGICVDCGLDATHEFDEMELDHILPLRCGGNNTLLNLELMCKMHNREKSARICETRDYTTVVRHAWDVPRPVSDMLAVLFRLEATTVDFPVTFPHCGTPS